ncbi:hypothetical protein C8R48DRAFT_782333 [Suillus tomentosus]|nr:hypothetical protein C8R48DRAFT_782333 [Suillus tomentosus]
MPGISSKPDDLTPRPSRVGLPTLGPTPEARANNSVELPPSPIPSSTPYPRRTSSVSVGSASEPLKSSSAFTLKGEIRHSTDLLVAEIVVDSKLYPVGYEVLITPRPRDNAKFISLEISRENDMEPASSASTTDLPISSSVYTIPALPLHSSGPNADRPICSMPSPVILLLFITAEILPTDISVRAVCVALAPLLAGMLQAITDPSLPSNSVIVTLVQDWMFANIVDICTPPCLSSLLTRPLAPLKSRRFVGKHRPPPSL